MNSVQNKNKNKYKHNNLINLLTWITILVSASEILPPIKSSINQEKLVNLGLSRSHSIKVVNNETYIDPLIKQDILNTINYMNETFPNVDFNNNIGSFFIVDEINIDNAAGANIPDFNLSLVEQQYLNDEMKRKIVVTHETIHQLLYHGKNGRYHGFYDTVTKEGKFFSEAFVDYLTMKVLNISISDAHFYGLGYKGREHILILEKFINLESLVKLATEGTTQDLEKILEQYFKDVNVLELYDEIYTTDYNSNQSLNREDNNDNQTLNSLTYAFIDAYFEKLKEDNIKNPQDDPDYNKVKYYLKAMSSESEFGLYFIKKENEYISKKVR